MMRYMREGRATSFILLGILVVQLGISLFVGNQKSWLFMDEVFSYASANRYEGIEFKFPQNELLDERWYVDYMSAQEEHRFDYAIPYRNQISDVHPPLYYMLLHTSSSVIAGEFSYWAGLSWNIVLFMGCTITLFFLGKEMFKSRDIGLTVAFLYSISYGGLNTMVFIRMYMLLTFILLLHTWIYIRYMNRIIIPKRAYIFLGVTLVAGMMTQYYFLFAAFFFGVWYVCRYVKNRQWKNLAQYSGVIFASAMVCLLLFPAMWNHILGSGRGVEARGNFTSWSNFGENLKIMFQILDGQMFSKTWILILAVIFILMLLFRKQKRFGLKWQGGVCEHITGYACQYRVFCFGYEGSTISYR